MSYPAAEKQTAETFHFGHLKAVFFVAVLLFGVSWLRDPNLFNAFVKTRANQIAGADVPRYYAYVPPPQDQPMPVVAGASTDQGPSIINEDGSVVPVSSLGQVLGANTAEINLSLDSIKVSEVPDSRAALDKYLSDSAAVEGNLVNDPEFQAALTSGDQQRINREVAKVEGVIAALERLPVPHEAANLQKNKILQYQSAEVLLQNYTQADQNPDAVSQALSVFMQTQDDINSETAALSGASSSIDSLIQANADSNQ